MDADSLSRIAEHLCAAMIFDETKKQLKSEDLEYLKEFVDLQKSNKKGFQMKVSQFLKAKSIMQEIELLNKKKDFISGYPSECYRVEFRSASGNGVVTSNDEFGTVITSRLINEFKSCIDERIGKLEKEMEEI